MTGAPIAHVELLSGNRLLLGETGPRSDGEPYDPNERQFLSGLIRERDLNGKVVWKAPLPDLGCPPDFLRRVPNGNFLIMDTDGLREFTPEGKIVHQRKLNAPGRFLRGRLRNGRLMFEDAKPGILLISEYDHSVGRVLRKLTVEGYGYTLPLPNGHYLRCDRDFRELDSAGRELRDIPLPRGTRNVRGLKNGNLIAVYENRCLEITLQGNVVWEAIFDESCAGRRIAWFDNACASCNLGSTRRLRRTSASRPMCRRASLRLRGRRMRTNAA